jgi:hypothetical protein
MDGGKRMENLMMMRRRRRGELVDEVDKFRDHQPSFVIDLKRADLEGREDGDLG